jgi:hypothetical protein
LTDFLGSSKAKDIMVIFLPVVFSYAKSKYTHIYIASLGRVLESILRFVLRYVLGRFIGWSEDHLRTCPRSDLEAILRLS